MDLQNKVTPKQWQAIQSAGITSLYDLITFLPFKLTVIHWVQKGEDLQQAHNNLIQTSAQVMEYSFLGGRQRGVRITLYSQALGRILAFCFLPPRFIMRYLKSEILHRVTLRYTNGFWTILAFGTYHPHPQQENQLLPVYHKKNALDSKVMKAVIKRLSPQDFILNLQGLLPNTLGIPMLLSLENAHRPTSETLFHKTVSAWNEVQAFLQLAQLRFFSMQQLQSRARPSGITSEILAQVLHSHAYPLSKTQTEVIQTCIYRIRPKT